MRLIASFNTHAEAETALRKVNGEGQIMTEIIQGQLVFALLAVPTWSRLALLGQYNLDDVRSLLTLRTLGRDYDESRLQQLLDNLNAVAKTFDLDMPEEWTAVSG